MESHCQMLVTGISGGALDQLFSVFEFDAVDDPGEAFVYRKNKRPIGHERANTDPGILSLSIACSC